MSLSMKKPSAASKSTVSLDASVVVPDDARPEEPAAIPNTGTMKSLAKSGAAASKPLAKSGSDASIPSNATRDAAARCFIVEECSAPPQAAAPQNSAAFESRPARHHD